MKKPKRILRTFAATLPICAASCSSGLDLKSGMILCNTPYEADSFIGLYSLQRGMLEVPLVDTNQVDLVYYFDPDDCSRAALMGNEDQPGCIFPIGYGSWDELARLRPPAENDEAVSAIAPLTKPKEGLAFWLRTGAGEFVLVRILTVRDASHSELVSGTTPAVELEWLRPLLQPQGR